MEIKGDFLGFTFNGESTTSLGITRVSDGDRYKDQLVPEIEDKTVEIPGLDGAYFYGTNFKPKNFSLSVAFDDVSEEQLRKMKQLFGFRHIGDLIFDEWPYKKYLVKVASPPEFEYVCFDERKKHLGETSNSGVRIVDREYHEEQPAVYDSLYEEDVEFNTSVAGNCIASFENQSLYNSLSENDVIVLTIGEEQSKGTIEVNSSNFKILQGNNPRVHFFIKDDYSATLMIGGVEIGTYSVKIEKEVSPEVPAHTDITREEITPWVYEYDQETGEPLYERRYKGEGTIEFVAYYPFAKIVNKYLDSYDNENKDEWAAASKLRKSTWYTTEKIDTCVSGENDKIINLYNPGDKETGFNLYIPFDSGQIPALNIYYSVDGINKDLKIHIDSITKKGNDAGIKINTNNNLVEGYEVYGESTKVMSGNLYSEFVKGEMFKIEPSQTEIVDDTEEIIIQFISIEGFSGNTLPSIEYDYLYF